MKINLSRYAGFCDGVDRAYKIVERASKNKKVKKPIYMLGSLVHNENVVERIEKMGIKKVSFNKSVEKTFSKIKKIGTIIVTAHGFGPALYEYAQKNNIAILDTTCPRVFRVQRLAKAFASRGAQVVILGEKNHKEVKGIYEWAGKKAQIIEAEKDLVKLKLDKKREVILISQTTQNENLFEEIAEKLKKKNKKVKIFNTICDTTHNRQQEVKKMAKENEVMIVIGSVHSSNSNRLNEISKELNLKTYFIDSAKKIEKKWFQDVKKVGVSAGASTPKWIIEAALNKIKKIK